jgi:DNA-binding NarL/FixJ family response regulator
MPIRIAIVDDKPANRRMVAEKLTVEPLFEVVLTAQNGRDFLEQMAQASELPQLVLMDLEMPEMDGVAAIAAGSIRYPGVQFVVLTVFDDEERIFGAIKAGAQGYLLKEEPAERLTQALWEMHHTGGSAISPGIAHQLLGLVRGGQKEEGMPAYDTNFFKLTDREREILKLLAQGLGAKEVGTRLHISPHTARKHVVHIYEKLHVHNRAEAVLLAHERGLL